MCLVKEKKWRKGVKRVRWGERKERKRKRVERRQETGKGSRKTEEEEEGDVRRHRRVGGTIVKCQGED